MNNKNLIEAKLQIPHLGSGIIERSRLLAKMEDFQARKATCVVAPAGFGKTVFVSQFVTSFDMPIVWYQLDSFDNDPVQFFQYLVEGLANSIAGFAVALPEFGQEEMDTDRQCYNLMTKMIGELKTKVKNRLIIVFDDFHLINEPVILNFMELFLKYLPSSVHIIISCRYYPDIPMLKLKSNGIVMEINHQDLKLSQSEIKTLFSFPDKGTINERLLRSVENRMMGWALGLSLGKLLIESAQDEPADTALIETTAEIYTYIGRELFRMLPGDIQTFLMTTSVLEILTPEACNYMLNSQDASVKLKYIRQKNLFVIATGSGDDISYRYHPVFKEFLLNMLAEQCAATYDKAGCYYFEQGLYKQAVECFKLAGNDAMLQQVVATAGLQMLQRGSLQTLVGWMEMLRERSLLESPELILLQGAILSYIGSFDEAEYWIDRAFGLLKQTGNRDGLFRAAIHKARILRYHASFEQSLAYLDAFVAEMGEFPAKYRMEVQAERVFSLWLVGNIKEAITAAEDTVHQARCQNELKGNERLYRYLTVLYMLRGDYTQALAHYEEVLAACGNNLDLLEQDSVNYNVARIYRDRGLPAEAFQMMQDSVERKIRLGMTGDLYIVYINMALLCLDLQRYQDIAQYLQLSETNFKEGGGKWKFFLDFIYVLKIVLVSGENKDNTDIEKLIDGCVSSLQAEWPYMLLVASVFFIPYYMGCRQIERAETVYNASISYAEKSGFKYFISLLHGLKASIEVTQGELAAAKQHITICLELAAAEDYIQQFMSFAGLRPCLKIALLNNIESDFVERIILRLGNQAVPMLMELLRNDKPEQRMRAAALLTKIGNAEILTELSMLFYDPNQRLRTTGAQLYNELGKLKGSIPVKLFVRAIGTFRVFVYDDWETPLKWRTSKARELFAYFLFWRGQPVATERILSDIWPDTDVDKARDLLHTNLNYVKRQLKNYDLSASLIHLQNGYKLDISAISCDVWMIEHHNSGDKKGTGESNYLKQLADGTYMEDIYSEWTETRRAELEYKQQHVN